METPKKLEDITEFPGQIYFRHEQLAAHKWGSHSHKWGQLNYVARGIMYIETNGSNYIPPPQYAIWIPPGVVHSAYSLQDVEYRSLYLKAKISSFLPDVPCALNISQLFRVILNDFSTRKIKVPLTKEDLRLARVTIDQLLKAEQHANYLPGAGSPDLASLLQNIQVNPGDKRNMEYFATKLNITPRTLERRCWQELGMSFGEWRRRLKFIHSLKRLEEGWSIQDIASELNYSGPSSFINMFKSFTGLTPARHRKI